MSDKHSFDMNPFFWGIAIALLYLIIGRLDDIIELIQKAK
jgi:hypothetical protein